jgi:peptidoglycan L-alanyl-D-glutamate endopeptidase CwlK
MTYRFSRRSYNALVGVRPELIAVATRALGLSTVDFVVTEGLRTAKRQQELKAAGASQTLNSRHLTGHAIDLAPYVGGEIRWDWPLFYPLEAAMKQAAQDLGVPIEWGGDWKFRDGPHWQLPWGAYP